MAGTGVRFTVIETDDETKVDYGSGQLVIEDNGKLFYDPTGAFSGRFQFFHNEFSLIDLELRTRFNFRGIVNSLPASGNRNNDVYCLRYDVAEGTYAGQDYNFSDVLLIDSNYSVEQIEEGIYRHTFVCMTPDLSKDYFSYIPTENPITSFINQNNYQFVPEQQMNFSSTVEKTSSNGTYNIKLELISSHSFFQEWQDTVKLNEIYINFKSIKFNRGEYIVWMGDHWEKLMNVYDLSPYATTTYVNNLVGTINADIEDVLTGGV